MRTSNHTHWNTKDVIRLIRRVAQDELDQGQLSSAHITITYRRIDGNLGCCTYGTPLKPRIIMTLRLPRHQLVDSVELAQTIAHEFAHARGLRHRDMKTNERYHEIGDWRLRYAWAAEYLVARTIEPTAAQRQSKRNALAVSKAEKMVRKWMINSKRADTLLKKWQVRLRRSSLRTVLPLPATSVLLAGSNLGADSHGDKILALVS